MCDKNYGPKFYLNSHFHLLQMYPFRHNYSQYTLKIAKAYKGAIICFIDFAHSHTPFDSRNKIQISMFCLNFLISLWYFCDFSCNLTCLLTALGVALVDSERQCKSCIQHRYNCFLYHFLQWNVHTKHGIVIGKFVDIQKFLSRFNERTQ